MSNGDPNFSPAMKGDFVIDPRGRPKIHRKVGGRIVVEELYDDKGDELDGINELLSGVTSSDLRGPQSGFGARYAEKLQQEAAAGSGAPDRRHLRRQQDYQNGIPGASAPLDQGWEFSEDVGESDMFGQPANEFNREEYGEFPSGDEELVTSPNQFDEEDIWDLDILENFDQDRRSTPHPDEPTFSGRPHRQTEASTDSLADELDDLFSGPSDTFNSRGL